MPEQISTAGHGPSRGYSGMNKKLDNYLRTDPRHRDETKRISRSLGPRPGEFRKKKIDPEEAAIALLAHLEDAKLQLERTIRRITDGLSVFRDLSRR